MVSILKAANTCPKTTKNRISKNINLTFWRIQTFYLKPLKKRTPCKLKLKYTECVSEKLFSLHILRPEAERKQFVQNVLLVISLAARTENAQFRVEFVQELAAHSARRADDI